MNINLTIAIKWPPESHYRVCPASDIIFSTGPTFKKMQKYNNELQDFTWSWGNDLGPVHLACSRSAKVSGTSPMEGAAVMFSFWYQVCGGEQKKYLRPLITVWPLANTHLMCHSIWAFKKKKKVEFDTFGYSVLLCHPMKVQTRGLLIVTVTLQPQGQKGETTLVRETAPSGRGRVFVLSLSAVLSAVLSPRCVFPGTGPLWCLFEINLL